MAAAAAPALSPVRLAAAKPGAVTELRHYDLAQPWQELALRVRADAQIDPDAPFTIMREEQGGAAAAVPVLGGAQPDGRELAPALGGGPPQSPVCVYFWGSEKDSYLA